MSNLPDWVYRIPWGLVQDISKEMGLDHLIVASIIMVESSGQACAMRYEPGWSYHWNIEHFAERVNITPQTEHMLQATSFGLMQVMGTVAREHGHRGHLSELCIKKIGIKYGCKQLKKLYLRYGNYKDAVAAYNAGSVRMTDGGFYENEVYVDKVYNYYRQFKHFIER